MRTWPALPSALRRSGILAALLTGACVAVSETGAPSRDTGSTEEPSPGTPGVCPECVRPVPDCPGSLLGFDCHVDPCSVPGACPPGPCVRLTGIHAVADVSLAFPRYSVHAGAGESVDGSERETGLAGVPLISWTSSFNHRNQFVAEPLPRRGFMVLEDEGIESTLGYTPLGDLDGDGWIEMGAVQHIYGGSSEVRIVDGVLFAAGMGADESLPPDFVVQAGTSIRAAGDTNGDGRSDLVLTVSGTGGFVELYYGAPGPSWTLAAEIPSGFWGAADTDGDGADDLLLSLEAGIGVFRNPSGVMDPGEADLVVSGLADVYETLGERLSRDLDGDGLADLLASAPDDVETHLAVSLAGTGTIDLAASAFLEIDTAGLPKEEYPARPYGLDLDSDGFGDLFIDHQDGGCVEEDGVVVCSKAARRYVVFGPFGDHVDAATAELVLDPWVLSGWVPARSVQGTSGDMLEIYGIDDVMRMFVACE